jgi:DNA-binding MarR family transcriptional regulator
VRAVKIAVSSPVRLGILVTLYEAEKANEPLYFTKLVEFHGINEGLMTYHLKRLQDAGLITKKNSEAVGDLYRVYSLQDKGKKLIEDLGLDGTLSEKRPTEQLS